MTPQRSGAAIAATLVALACVLVSATTRITDTDLWQHLLVGKVIWARHAVPTTQLWTWPTHGAPDVNSSWGFRALLWPFWSAAGVGGLFVWRWLTTLVAFAVLLATARRMGARGFASLVVLVVCGLIYRQRSQPRPETLVAVLLALTLWILERRRATRAPDNQLLRDPALWLVPVAWAWANVHLSWFLAPLLLGFHAVDAIVARGPRPPGTARLVVIGLAMVAIALVNPFGWRALWQPFEFLLVQRHEPLFEHIRELHAVNWSLNLRNGLPLVLVAWPALALWRWRRRGLDLFELLLCATFTALGLGTQRFVGFYAIVATPYLVRDLDTWVAARNWPRWTAAPALRAAVVSVACVAVALPEWTRADPALGIGIDARSIPIHACDFIAREGVRGRAMNQFRNGGYLLWRFWPDQDRLPFMDIHQAGTREIRAQYDAALTHDGAWQALERRHGFGWALVMRPPTPGDHLLDFLDRDSTWALVFVDDAGAVYVRRAGAFAALADSLGYRVLPAGRAAMDALPAAIQADTTRRVELIVELQRAVRSSPACAQAASLLANLALQDQRYAIAEDLLRRALEADASRPLLHERLGIVALATERPQRALAEFEAEGRRPGPHPDLELRLGMAYQMLGDVARARRHYQAQLARDPGNEGARELLQALPAEGGR